MNNISSSLLDLRRTLPLADVSESLYKNTDLVELVREQSEVSLKILNNTFNVQNANRVLRDYFAAYIGILINPNLLFTSSCASVHVTYPSSPSGYYWFRDLNGSFVSMYCDMDRTCGGVAGGWTRLVKWDMTDCSAQCPADFIQYTNSNTRTCGIKNVYYGPMCSMTNFSLPNDMEYSKVCGRVKAYSVGSPGAFNVGTADISIENNYVDGVSLTHGPHGSRAHIWTFAASVDNSNQCPCNNGTSSSPPPSFVGSDHLCDAHVPSSPL